MLSELHSQQHSVCSSVVLYLAIGEPRSRFSRPWFPRVLMGRLRSSTSCLVLSSFLVLAALVGSMTLAGCGGGGGTGTGGGGNAPPTVTSVTVSCVSTKVLVEGTVQCSATVQGTNNPRQAVIWSVNNTTGGMAPSGRYQVQAFTLRLTRFHRAEA